MNTTIEKPVSDFDYTEYQARQQYAVTSDNIHLQSHALRNSDKFVFDGDKWIIKPYHGFAVVSMVANNPFNDDLVDFLNSINHYLNERLNKQQTYFILPEDSYHQTVANTLSDTRYFENIVKRGILNQYPDMIREAFGKIKLCNINNPLKMQMTGLNVFGSCLAVLGTFSEESDYSAISGFRNQFYGNPEMKQADVRWTRPFVGHTTLAYLGRAINTEERTLLANTINDINSSYNWEKAVFHIAKAELRSYTDLSSFETEPNYPIFNFVK